MDDTAVIFMQIIERPARKLVVQWSKTANDYLAYATEIGSGTRGASAAWDVLTGIAAALYEPVGLWLPESLRPAGTGMYAHGVEVPATFHEPIPEGFAVIDLAPSTYMLFQCEPYHDADFATAVAAGMARIQQCNPEVYGYRYTLDTAPRMQLAPAGWRGYIEMWPVERIAASAVC